MKASEIVNTLTVLKTKTQAVNTRAQAITMSNGKEMSSGGGPYPVRSLHSIPLSFFLFHQHDGLEAIRSWLKDHDSSFVGMLVWAMTNLYILLETASHRRAP